MIINYNHQQKHESVIRKTQTINHINSDKPMVLEDLIWVKDNHVTEWNPLIVS
jgi:hypothetical protein